MRAVLTVGTAAEATIPDAAVETLRNVVRGRIGQQFDTPFFGPSPDMGVSSDDRYFSVQVMVRGAPDGYAAAETVATDCLTALDRWLPNSDGYVECKVQSAGPVNAGLADQAQPRFTLNVKLTYHG